jgi:hypothetical protein
MHGYGRTLAAYDAACGVEQLSEPLVCAPEVFLALIPVRKVTSEGRPRRRGGWWEAWK